MRLYVVRVPPEETEGDRDRETWVSSRAAAMKIARDFVRASDADDEVEVSRVEIADLPPKELAIALLNGRGYVADRELLATIKIPRRDR